MSADYKMRPWEADGEVLEVLFGNGTVNLCPECGQVLTDADDLEDRDIGEPVG